jgi:ATP/maltotriose-dependent transcriptional regulator MalT
VSLGAKLLILSRRLPPGALAQRVGAGEVALVASDDLTFTEEECSAWARSRVGANADGLERRLFELSAGWAVCLTLLVEHLRMGGTLSERVEGVSAQLFSFLTDEVVAGLAPQERD